MPRAILPRPVEIPIGPSIAYVPLTRGFYALIDSSDASSVSHFNWHAANCHSELMYARTWLGGSPMRGMHHLIMGYPPQGLIDHRNGNGLDNRKANLRLVTEAQNSMNRRPHRGSRSGLKGVYWDNDRKKWASRIFVNKRIVALGRFHSPEEAHEAYKAAAVKHFGEFARSE